MSVTHALDLAPFDAADYLTTPELVAEYLNAALAEGDAAFLQVAMDTVRRSPAFLARPASLSQAASNVGSTGQTKQGFTDLPLLAAAFGFRLEVVSP